jgi:hypothetical protein
MKPAAHWRSAGTGRAGLITCIFALLANAAVAAQSPAAAEELAMPLFPAGWVAFAGSANNSDIIEYFPEGESAGNWQSKISIETYRRLNLPLDTLQRRAVAQARDSCDGIVEGKFQSGLNNGYPSAFWTLGCKRERRTGSGETRYTKAIQSTDTLYVITRAWRSKAYGDSGPELPEKSVQEGLAFLTNTVVCERGSTIHPCPKSDAGPPK